MTRTTKLLLYLRARRQHSIVEPCATKRLADCYRMTAGVPSLWYNDADGNTRMVQVGGDGSTHIVQAGRDA